VDEFPPAPRGSTPSIVIDEGRPTSSTDSLRAQASSNHDGDDTAAKLWSRFDRDSSGFITRKDMECEDFYAIIRGLAFPSFSGKIAAGGGASYSRSAMDMKQAVKICLQKADLNSDGVLTFPEFRALVASLTQPQDMSHSAYLIFSIFDLDMNGYISFDEFSELLRFVLNHRPTVVRLQYEWDLLMAGHEGDGKMASRGRYIRWLRDSMDPLLRQHAPPKRSRLDESTVSHLGTLSRSRSTVVSTQSIFKQRWNRNINRDLSAPPPRPRRRGEHLPKDERYFFDRPHSLAELDRFFAVHHGFQRQRAKLRKPEQEESGTALCPKAHSSEGCLPLLLPGRHSPGGTMRHHQTGEVTRWESQWMPPMRTRTRFRAADRPVAPGATFSEPDRPLPPELPGRRGAVALATRARASAAKADALEVHPARATVLEAEPW